MKPYIHAQNSVKKYRGKISDYLEIHNWFDQTKAHVPQQSHRAVLHNSFGIFLCEQVFGETITNSSGKKVSVRALGEDHVIEDLGCIPTLSDYLMFMELKPWMQGNGLPPSLDKKFYPTIPIPVEPPKEENPYDPWKTNPYYPSIPETPRSPWDRTHIID